MDTKGINTIPSPFSVRETMDKLQALIRSNGATVYARIDQQLELGKAGLSIPPLEFIMFGNPAVGGKLMQARPVAALDLPLKIITWEDENKKVWVASNEGQYIANRYQLSPDAAAGLDLAKLISKALN